MKTSRKTKKGFTLAELLIVIAIIAVLVAIMFPVFGAQLNKARAAAELANVRAKYSEMVADAMLGSDASGNLTGDVASSVSIDIKVLATAMTHTDTKMTVTFETDKPGTIKVDYKGFYGEFKTDEDVTFTVGAAAAASGKTYNNAGNEV